MHVCMYTFKCLILLIPQSPSLVFFPLPKQNFFPKGLIPETCTCYVSALPLSNTRYMVSFLTIKIIFFLLFIPLPLHLYNIFSWYEIMLVDDINLKLSYIGLNHDSKKLVFLPSLNEINCMVKLFMKIKSIKHKGLKTPKW
jgi:hypothetical protein